MLHQVFKMALLVSLGYALVAQTAPPAVLNNTPPPALTDGVPRSGAGGYTLPDGQRLIPAIDPFSGANITPQAQVGPTAQDQGNSAPVLVDPNAVAQQYLPNPGSFKMRTPADISAANQQALNAPDPVGKETRDILTGLSAQNTALITALQNTKDGKKNDGLEVDPEGALIAAKIDPKTGKPRRKASDIARESGLVMIPAGTMLSVRNYTRVITELGGTCIGILEYDVLDAQMKAVAIPRGSRVLASVQKVSGAAQDRAALIFRQIVDPNGDQIQLMVSEPAANSIGMAGIGTSDGAIINRYLGQKFGYALVWGIVGGLAGKNTASPYTSGATFGSMVQQNVSSQFGTIGQNELQAGMAIQSTIEIPENTSMRVILGNPIYVTAWKSIRPF